GLLNVCGLVGLVCSITAFNQRRAGLIEASVRSLQVQGEMIAGAIAGAATLENDSTITVDPNRLLDLQAGDIYDKPDDFGFDFSINPERVGPLLRRLVLPTNTRARIYGSAGALLIDSRNVGGRGGAFGSGPSSPTLEEPRLVGRPPPPRRRWAHPGGPP